MMTKKKTQKKMSALAKPVPRITVKSSNQDCPNIVPHRIEHLTERPAGCTSGSEPLIDHYYWMRERENPKVLEYIESENKVRFNLIFSNEFLVHERKDEAFGRIAKESIPRN